MVQLLDVMFQSFAAPLFLKCKSVVLASFAIASCSAFIKNRLIKRSFDEASGGKIKRLMTLRVVLS